MYQLLASFLLLALAHSWALLPCSVIRLRSSLHHDHKCVDSLAKSTFGNTFKLKAGQKTILKEFDPLEFCSDEFMASGMYQQTCEVADTSHRVLSSSKLKETNHVRSIAATTALSALVVATTTHAERALAASSPSLISQGSLDPQNFQPVCPASDGLYRLLQASTEAVVGTESFRDYGPLIAGGLLRVRLELCVVESFVNEAVIPFVKQNGLNWILPVHETVETFLAGVIFAIASTFILIGSTKILTVLFTYTDFLLGFPFRTLGGFVYDRSLGKPVTLDIGIGPFKTRVFGPPKTVGPLKEVTLADLGPISLFAAVLSGILKVFGMVVGLLRDALDAIDTFVGRYLVFWASLYILIKFVHYKILPDFP